MTSIPAVLAALTSLGTATLGTGWQAINGPIGSVTTTEDRVLVVGEQVLGQRDLDSMGIDTTSEQYTVQLDISVDFAGTDQTAADNAALNAYAAMEVAIREFAAGPNLGLAASGVLSALPTGDFELRRRADDDGRHALVKFFVAVYAQNS